MNAGELTALARLLYRKERDMMRREKKNRDSMADMPSAETLEQELRIWLRSPLPQKRDSFLTGSPQTYMSHGAFVLTQAGYIRGWVWALSLAVFGVLVGVAGQRPGEALWVAMGMMPFLALIAAQEHMRSNVHNMAELEMATRFSVKSVLLARMALLGGFHLALLLLLLPVLGLCGQSGLLRTGIYLLTPYLLTTFLSMAWARKVRGRESLYLCFGIAVVVSSLQAAAGNMDNWYSARLFPWWVLVLAALIVGNIWEYYQAICCTDSIYENMAA